MTREEAFEDIKDMYSYELGAEDQELFNFGWDAAKDEFQPQWIPITRELPEPSYPLVPGTWVLAAVTGYEEPLCLSRVILNDECVVWTDEGGDKFTDDEVTHWMHLPKKPK